MLCTLDLFDYNAVIFELTHHTFGSISHHLFGFIIMISVLENQTELL